jgi:hypothetical protein
MMYAIPGGTCGSVITSSGRFSRYWAILARYPM